MFLESIIISPHGRMLFWSAYLKELECYLRKHHSKNGLKGEPHVLEVL